jgi:hypothetical protein
MTGRRCRLRWSRSRQPYLVVHRLGAPTTAGHENVMADAGRRLRRRCCASFDRRQHAGAPRECGMEHVGAQRCSCHARQQNLCSWTKRAVQQAQPFGCPDRTLREGNSNRLSLSRFNEHLLCARFIGNPLCPRAADHISRNDRRITSRAAAACKTSFTRHQQQFGAPKLRALQAHVGLIGPERESMAMDDTAEDRCFSSPELAARRTALREVRPARAIPIERSIASEGTQFARYKRVSA